MYQVGLAPDAVLSPRIDETQRIKEKPRDYVLRIAVEKAVSIDVKHNDFLITADTIVNLGAKILHKTSDAKVAEDYLRQISGRRHNVFSAICIKHRNKLFFGIEKTIVKMRRLSDHEVEDYLSSKEWMNRAGGYAIQGAALKFFPSILGCYSNIVGLPLTLLLRKLKASGFRYER